MSTKINRNVVVTRSEFAVVVGFHWDEPESFQPSNRQHKCLVYWNGAILGSVNVAVDVLMRGGSCMLKDDDYILERWDEFDQNADLFDLIVDAEEPEQALVSRYVLED